MNPIMLIGVSLLLLVGIGAMDNNLTNSGLSTTPTLSCPGWPDVTCQNSATIGCQSLPAQCSLNATSISFLDNCSPFTQLLQLNFVQFVSLFFNSCSGGTFAQGAQQQSANFPQTGNVTLPGLKATYSFHTLNGQVQWKSSLLTHPIVQGITTPYFLTCLSFRGVLSTGQTTYNCNWVDSSTPTPNGETMSCWLFGNATDVNNAICNNWAYSQAGGGTTQLVTNLLQGNILGFFMSLIGGILLLMLGLGINVGAATFNAGSNPQGSKLAQVFGIGLLIWGPLYSEFSSWITPALLPNGLNAVVSVLVIGTYFYGLYILSTSGASGSR